MKRREEEKIRRAEWLKQQELEAERRREEQRKQQEALAERQRIQDEEVAQKRAKQEEERRQRKEDFRKNLASNFDQQETQVRDAAGNRWIKCEFCGKIAMESEFSSYGGAIGVHLNLGICKECSLKNTETSESHHGEERRVNSRKYDPMVCPECGGRLIERNGKNGRFIGCLSYPRCRYTRSIRKNL